MSSKPQLSPVVDFEASMFENKSSLISRSHGATAISCPSVLLVGRNGSWGKPVLKSLEKFGAELSFAPPQTVTPEHVRKGAHNIILLDSTGPPEQRRQLACALAGSSS